MNKLEILKKVRRKEQEQDELIEKRKYEQKCISVCVCPKCGHDLREDFKISSLILGFSRFFYRCNKVCKYKVEVTNFNDRIIKW